MAWQEPFHIAVANSFQRLDKAANITSMVSIDRPYASIAIDVVATE
jgi:hypothetical protein